LRGSGSRGGAGVSSDADAGVEAGVEADGGAAVEADGGAGVEAGGDAVAGAAAGGGFNGPLIPQAASARTAIAKAAGGTATMPRNEATNSRNIGLAS
jgi:hypothetical protein